MTFRLEATHDTGPIPEGATIIDDDPPVEYVAHDGKAYTASDRVLLWLEQRDGHFIYPALIPGVSMEARRSPWHWHQMGLVVLSEYFGDGPPALVDGTVPDMGPEAVEDTTFPDLPGVTY